MFYSFSLSSTWDDLWPDLSNAFIILLTALGTWSNKRSYKEVRSSKCFNSTPDWLTTKKAIGVIEIPPPLPPPNGGWLFGPV